MTDIDDIKRMERIRMEHPPDLCLPDKHCDIAYLLAEIDRLQATIKRVREKCDVTTLQWRSDFTVEQHVVWADLGSKKRLANEILEVLGDG